VELYPRQYLYLRAVRAKLFIDANFHHPIDLHDVADEACFSKYHFIRLFRSIYGRTPHQYLIVKRIDAAKDLLAAGENIKSVCFRVGFESVGSFSSLFKRRTGVTPKQFQDEKLRVKDLVAERPLEFVPGCFASRHGWLQNSNFRENEFVDA
jgi:AraC-like DNA-binding protein